MTRERAKELLPVIQAWAEGKSIQFYSEGIWKEIVENPGWVSYGKYRIKPEPRVIWLLQKDIENGDQLVYASYSEQEGYRKFMEAST